MDPLGGRDRSRYHASVDTGTPYPCSQKDIDRAVHLSPQRRNGVFVEINLSIEDVIHYNRLDRSDPPPVAAAASRLHDAIRSCLRHGWGRDIIIKVGTLQYTSLGIKVFNLYYVANSVRIIPSPTNS
jgi:hypothetical protein